MYKHDLFGPDETNGIPEDRLDYLKAFLLQVANLGPLESGGPVPNVSGVTCSQRMLFPGTSLWLHSCTALASYRDEWLSIAPKEWTVNGPEQTSSPPLGQP